MKVLGIDPGLAHTGWAIVEKEGSDTKALAYGYISTKPQQNIAARLATIHDGIRDVIVEFSPQEVAIEDVFFGVNASSAFALGQARGAAILATSAFHVPLGEYSPTEIKKAVVGQGRADKRQVMFMVKTQLSLDHDPKPDHCSDALAVALTHIALTRAAIVQTKVRGEA